MTGRPTKYSQEMVDKAQDYLENYTDYDQVIPSEAGLALHLELARSTVQDWGKHEDKKVFSGILRSIQAKQEVVLVNSGLTGAFNSAIAKLALGKHGYSEKQDQTLSGIDGQPIQVDQQWTIEVIEGS